MLILRKSLSSILLIILCLTLIACEANSSIPLYKYYENKLEAMEKKIMAEEGLTLEDISLTLEEVKKKYILQPKNDDELLLSTYLGYEQKDSKEAEKIITFTDQIIKNLYNWDYTRSRLEDINEASCLMSEDLSDAIIQSRVFGDLIDNFIKYKASSLVRNAEIMPENYIEVFKTQSGDLIYRVWAYLIIDIKADEKFYTILPQYTVGDTSIELWLYISPTKDKHDYKLIMWRENFRYTNYQVLYSSQSVGKSTIDS